MQSFITKHENIQENALIKYIKIKLDKFTRNRNAETFCKGEDTRLRNLDINGFDIDKTITRQNGTQMCIKVPIHKLQILRHRLCNSRLNTLMLHLFSTDE